MIRNKLGYKTIQKMIESVGSGKHFTKRLKGRCFTEAFFEDLEWLASSSNYDFSNSVNAFIHPDKDQKVFALPITRRYPLAIAASISLLLVALYFSVRIFLPNEVNTSYGEYVVVELPDNSTITLNSKTEISYNPISWYWDRRVSLKGEAFFSVKKGIDFIVNTAAGNVKVLGTTFNVSQRENDFVVECRTGKVEVSTSEHISVLLPNEKIELNTLDGSLVKSSKESQYIASWKEGYFDFNSEKLSKVLNTLELQYGVEIVSSNTDEHLFTGYFPIKNLDNSLETVCSAFGLEYRFSVNEDKNQVIYIE
jgi:transmembrane sensor